MRDVTEDFVAASKQLQSGELVKDEYFTLFEAVGALEVCRHASAVARLRWGLVHHRWLGALRDRLCATY